MVDFAPPRGPRQLSRVPRMYCARSICSASQSCMAEGGFVKWSGRYFWPQWMRSVGLSIGRVGDEAIDVSAGFAEALATGKFVGEAGLACLAAVRLAFCFTWLVMRTNPSHNWSRKECICSKVTAQSVGKVFASIMGMVIELDGGQANAQRKEPGIGREVRCRALLATWQKQALRIPRTVTRLA